MKKPHCNLGKVVSFFQTTPPHFFCFVFVFLLFVKVLERGEDQNNKLNLKKRKTTRNLSLEFPPFSLFYLGNK